MTDTALKCTYISEYWRKFTGRDPAQDLGFTWIEALHPEDRARAKRDLTEASEARHSCSGEYRVRRANGEYAWFHDVGVAYFDTKGSYAGYIGTCVDITDHKMQDSAGQQVRQSLLLGQEAEQKRLAGELHDDISQKLVLTRLTLNEVLRLAPAADAVLKERLHAVREQIEGIASDVRRLSHNLHPATIRHLGLVTALRKLCGEFSGRHVNVEFVGAPMPAVPIAEDLTLGIFRITQEALANVAKHSKSPSARVSLSERDGSLHLAIADQGTGFDVEQRGAHDGLGLTSIRERAWLIGGDLQIRSTRSRGTHIDLTVPLGTSEKTK